MFRGDADASAPAEIKVGGDISLADMALLIAT
jgi:hypothetical protein